MDFYQGKSPTQADWEAVKKLVRYLKKTRNKKLMFTSNDKLTLSAYTDADWAGCKTDCKSTSGFICLLGDSIISWSSKKQLTVSLSSTEAEYIAAAHCCQEILWISQLLEDCCITIDKPIKLYEDNQSCIKMSSNEKFSARSKHINIKYHFLKDLINEKFIEMVYCPTDLMLADLLTKPLPKLKVENFCKAFFN